MNETLRQFSEQLALELKGKFSSEETVAFIAKSKESGDDRSFEVVMSTSDEDRQGDELDQSKWDLKYFNLNPVVLWAHDYSSFPIGTVDDIRIEGDKAIATGHFAPAGMNPEADMACSLYQEKILKTVSPGYIQNDDGTRELLEMSFCSVPAGRNALSLRQVGRLGVSTRDLVTKGFFYEEKRAKDSQAGDPCQMDDGSPGLLAEDAGDPGKLICVPTEDKAAKPNETKEPMKDELENKIKAEHARHGEEVGKSIDEFSEKCMKGEKAEGHLDKCIDEYAKAMDGEQADHLEKCMKAIDDGYELQDQAKKSIDEFKAEMTGEHLTHVKACDKAIDEFKSEPGYSDDEKQKAIDTFTKSMGDELERHEKAHMGMVKSEAEATGDGDGKKSEDEKAIDALIADHAKMLEIVTVLKSGRTISSATKEKLKAISEKMDSHHTDVTAALKELMGSEEGNGGEEHKPEEKGGAPELKVEHLGSKSDLDTYLFTQRLVRQVKTASEGALRQINERIREARSGS